jgi:serine/threonine protein phosphatase PrpC
MSQELKLSIGQHTDQGRKAENQDFHGALIPEQPLLGTKGIVIALADGISSSNVSRVASESAIKSFLTDYYCTSDAWSVKLSAQRVIAATNSWLHAQTRRGENAYDKDKGYVCTLSVLVVKSTQAHIFHVGDSRIYRAAGNSLEQLTNDHRVVVSSEQSYLGRALGVNPQIEIDYRAVPLERGDVFVMATDGVYEHVADSFILQSIAAHADDLDHAARAIVVEALARGSQDNLTIQIVRVDSLPIGQVNEAIDQASDLPVPPLLDDVRIFDGYRILRKIHASSRSHLYLAADTDTDTGERVVLKIPSLDLRADAAYLRRFAMEEWVARRVNSVHVLKAPPQTRTRNYLYVVTEFIEGKTLTQWMADNPAPDLETVRGIVEQIDRGLRAFHRMEMLHQDLRPDNIMIDTAGTVRIVDFGAVKLLGVTDGGPTDDPILGTVQYTAPEYFLGDGGSPRSDLFSLGVIAYQMLTGALPYGARAARAMTKAQQRKLVYQSALANRRDIPVWVDGALKKAVHPDPQRRYESLSEFMFDLRHPKDDFLRASAVPLLERNPLVFWQGLSFALAMVIALLLAFRVR